MTSYNDLLSRVKRINNIGHAQGVLRWDQEVMMPEGGTPARAQQLSTLSSLSHELLVSDDTKVLLRDSKEEIEGKPREEAVIREVERVYERGAEVPNELVEEISRKTSEAHPVWRESRESNTWKDFEPVLTDLIDLRKRYAEHIAPDKDPYSVLFEDYEPYLDISKADDVLGSLKKEIVPLLDEIRDVDFDPSRPFTESISTDRQKTLLRNTLGALGFDWSHGRLDESPHPFSSGNPFDARITTRFSEDHPLESLTSTIHEFGHASYTLGLPREHYGSPLGESRDLTIHESQSRLWENNVARSKEFMEYITPKISDAFGLDSLDSAEIYEYLNRVYPDNLIRVEADELTYHLHIVLRYEIEQELINGDMDVGEVPVAWNNKMDEYLGVTPDTDSDGCLQDIHWSHGSFGYFPTYTLGSVLAAQIYNSAEDEIDGLDEKIKKGEFGDLMNWLRENIHRHGKRYTTDELIREATGDDLVHTYFTEYIENKFKDIYGLA